jgi:hypothetical protein
MVPMPRDTQPQQPDTLYSRVIFTAEEYAALTIDDQVLLDGDLLAALDSGRQYGWNFNVEDVVSETETLPSGAVVVSKTVTAYPFGVAEL